MDSISFRYVDSFIQLISENGLHCDFLFFSKHLSLIEESRLTTVNKFITKYHTK